MNRRFSIAGLVVLTVLCAGAAGSRSKAKLAIGSPISVDAAEARMSYKEVDALFQNEITLRDRMLAERFFAKPLSDQKSTLGAMISYLGLDPLHGMQPRFVLDGAKNEAAMKDYNDWARYLVEGHMRLKLHTLLRKAQVVLFDRPAQMVGQLEFYRKVGAEASAGLRLFDDIMYKLASGTPAFRKENPEGGKWSDVLAYCKVDSQTFYYYYQIDENTRQLRLDSYFLNQLGAVKTHGDALPPATAEEWTKAAEKFKNEDVAQYRQAAQAAVERANRNPRVVALMEKDLAVVEAMEKILDGMRKINDAFNDGENSAGRLRTGKGLYKYTKGKYSLPDMPKDKVPDHVFLLNLMLTRYQGYMQGLKVRMQGVTEEQRRKSAAWQKKRPR